MTQATHACKISCAPQKSKSDPGIGLPPEAAMYGADEFGGMMLANVEVVAIAVEAVEAVEAQPDGEAAVPPDEAVDEAGGEPLYTQ